MNKCVYRVSVKTLVKDDKNRILLVEEKDNNGFELPGGGIENGESIKEAIEREILEELGVHIVTLQDSPTFNWIINGEVIWLIYEISLDSHNFINNNHIVNAKFFSVDDLKTPTEINLGYCCKKNVKDLLNYLDD